MKKNLVIPLFISSLFFTSNVDSAVFDFYEQQNNNLLIAEGGCGGGGGGGMKPADKLKQKEQRKKAQDAAKKRLKKSEEALKDIDKLINPEDINESKIFKKHIKDVVNYTENIINDNTKITYENEELIPFSRCVIFTLKAVEANENDNTKRAKAYSKLSNKSIERDLKILKENKTQLKQKGIDEKKLKFIELTLRSLNSLIGDNYEDANKYLLESINIEKKAGSPLKKLVPFTKLLSGDIDEGCSDLEDLIVDGTIDIEDFDENFPIEDICRFPD